MKLDTKKEKRKMKKLVFQEYVRLDITTVVIYCNLEG